MGEACTHQAFERDVQRALPKRLRLPRPLDKRGQGNAIHLVNSLASLAEEVRGKLRKSGVIRKRDLTPRYINANRNR